MAAEAPAQPDQPATANRPAPADVSAAATANSTTATTPAPAGPVPAAGHSQPPQMASTGQQQQPDLQAAAGAAPATQPLEAPVTAGQTAPVARPEAPTLPAVQQIADSVKLIVQQGETEVRMQLYPKSLGQVHIQLHLTHEGTLAVRMLTETAHAQSLIQDHLPQLKAAFSAQGMQVSQMNVDVGSDSSAFYHQARYTGHNPFAGAQPTAHHRGYADDPTSNPVAVQNQAKPGSLNAIDYHA
ncbi:MAG: hypothetical protein Kow0031_35260 [Anaerolineae bacterium]